MVRQMGSNDARSSLNWAWPLAVAVVVWIAPLCVVQASDIGDVFEDAELRSSAKSFAERLKSPFLPSDDEPLETDRPDFVEASSLVPRGRVQLESGYTFTRDRVGDIEATAHAVPQFVWRIGLTERFEMRMVWDNGYNFEREVDRGAGTVTKRSGGGDMDLGLKTALLKPNGWIPEACVISTLSVPTGADEYRSSKTQPKFNLLYGWDLTDDLSFAGATGLQYLFEDDDNFIQISQAFTTGYSITEKLGMYVEWFSFYYDGANDGKPQHYADSGFTYKFTPNFQVDIRAGIGLNDAANDLFTGVGYALRW
jgi:outer membrane putative beta-barrel porin/alpha-amylase